MAEVEAKDPIALQVQQLTHLVGDLALRLNTLGKEVTKENEQSRQIEASKKIAQQQQKTIEKSIGQARTTV